MAASPASEPLEPQLEPQVRRGGPSWLRVCLAVFLGGFSTFWLLYWPQSLLPHLARSLFLTPAASSAVLTVSTAALALAQIPASFLADRFGRKPLMSLAMFLAALLSLLAALAADYTTLLVLRFLAGVVLAGLPAVAIAYLAEEVEPASLGSAMGIYIGATALGGMSGRLVTSLLVEYVNWHWAGLLVGTVGLVAALAFTRVLPASRHFTPRALPIHAVGRHLLWQEVRDIVRDPGLPSLFLIGGLLMGCFISVYNYLEFRLELPPFNLDSAAIGGVFLLYLFGGLASAWSGRLTRRLGSAMALRAVLALMLGGLLLTLVNQLIWVVMGIAIFTSTFFAGHAMASSWVGQRGGRRKALAASLYLSSYYLGGSVMGSLTGLLWARAGWPGVVALLALTLLLALWATKRLKRLPALHHLREDEGIAG